MNALHLHERGLEMRVARIKEDYRFCGYGEAMGGAEQARRGLRKVMCAFGPDRGWKETARAYRKLLYAAGGKQAVSETGRPKRRGFAQEQVEAVIQADGGLPLNALLRCRVRYFTDGAVLGSRAFVDEVFRRHRDRFGAKRASGARAMAGGQWGGLCTLRQLRLEVISPSPLTG